ncbi:Las1 domain containing protein [Pyrenophora tritici-repentis]|nr:Las1 domain containing protein [Pyrenophora tritici-repentis]
MSGHMQTSQLHHRTSRGSTNQPACRSARVEKPKSHHNSPKAMERRKTTTEPKLYATLDDHYRMMFGMAADEVEERPQPSRPVSWHPSCSQYQATQSQQQWPQEYSPSSRDSCHGSDFYSLSTRNSMFEPMTTAPIYSNDSDYGWQSVSQHTPTYMHSSMSTPTTEPLPWYLQQWAQKNQAQASSDFLPIQHPSQQNQDMEEDDGEKLVALGLYDAPEPSSFVTGLADTQIELTRDRPSWFVPGKALQLPLALLETRHRIVHRHLPSLAELKRTAAESLEWLWEWYWSQLETAFSGANGEGEAVEYEEIGVETTQVFKEKLQGLLKSYLKDRKAEIKSKTVGHDGFNAVSKAVSSYTTLCSTILNISGSSPPPQIKNITLHTLLDPKTILPTDRKLGSSMSGAFLIWTPLLLAFCSSPDPTTTPATIPLPTLLAHMLKAMDAPSSRSPENDPVKEAWHDWVLHVLTSREWETARKAVGVVEEVLGNW